MKDVKDCISLLDIKASAEMGIADAQFRLGKIYHKGLGIKQNFAEAFKWYLKAAEQGYAMAQNNLGNMYYKGEGVAQD